MSPNPSHEVEIAAPAERVFEWLAEPERMRQWVGGLLEFRQIDEGPRKGARAVQVVELGGSRWQLESEITRYEPPRALDAVLRHPRLELASSYRLEERAPGTLLRAEVEIRANRLLRAVARGQARRKLEADLARLKVAVEAAAA